MSVIDLAQARRLAFGVVLAQAAVSVAAALCGWVFSGQLAAVSAAVGGGIATIGSLVMAGLVFGGDEARGAQRALSAFYVGELVKIVIVIVLFVVVLRVMRVAPLAMFAAFAATFLVYWIALLAALPTMGGARRGG